jgi:hypothetical protein
MFLLLVTEAEPGHANSLLERRLLSPSIVGPRIPMRDDRQQGARHGRTVCDIAPGRAGNFPLTAVRDCRLPADGLWARIAVVEPVRYWWLLPVFSLVGTVTGNRRNPEGWHRGMTCPLQLAQSTIAALFYAVIFGLDDLAVFVVALVAALTRQPGQQAGLLPHCGRLQLCWVTSVDGLRSRLPLTSLNR